MLCSPGPPPVPPPRPVRFQARFRETALSPCAPSVSPLAWRFAAPACSQTPHRGAQPPPPAPQACGGARHHPCRGPAKPADGRGKTPAPTGAPRRPPPAGTPTPAPRRPQRCRRRTASAAAVRHHLHQRRRRHPRRQAPGGPRRWRSGHQDRRGGQKRTSCALEERGRRVVDLAGKTVVPGFIDAWGRCRGWGSIRGGGAVAAPKAALRRERPGQPPAP